MLLGQWILKAEKTIALYEEESRAAISRVRADLADPEQLFNFCWWAIDLIHAYANLCETDRAKRVVQDISKGTIPPERLVLSMQAWTAGWFDTRISGSTNPISNLMDKAKSNVAAGWNSPQPGHLDRPLRRAFDALLAEWKESQQPPVDRATK